MSKKDEIGVIQKVANFSVLYYLIKILINLRFIKTNARSAYRCYL